uniref:Chemotaxis protein CheA n=1 Tax=Magnetococcus massalia (strain MO-1) TaxID=451514 RepID=A0A1S7LE45_MAGMO|nr:putative Chemotaxis histidine kinase [Candidatus Magnetococcus massalia]
MELDADFLELLLSTFRTELEDQTSQISDGLLALEQGLPAEQQQETLHHIFRAAHNIKGAARGVEITPVSDLSHKLESLFSTLHKREQLPDAALIGLALQGVDRIRSLGEEISPGEPSPADVLDLMDQLDVAIDNHGAHSASRPQTPAMAEPEEGSQPKAEPPPTAQPSASTPAESAPEPVAPEPAEKLPHRSVDQQEADRLAQATPAAAVSSEPAAQELTDAATTAPVVDQQPHHPDTPLSQLAAQEQPQEIVAAVVEEESPPAVEVTSAAQPVAVPEPPAAPAEAATPAAGGSAAATPQSETTRGNKGVASRHSSSAGEVVRVPSAKINEAIAMAEELQITKVQMEGLQAGIRELEGQIFSLMRTFNTLPGYDTATTRLPEPEEWSHFMDQAPDQLDQLSSQVRGLRFGINERAKRMSFLSDNLQQGLRMMRLVPVSTMTRHLVRQVRDLALELGKRVQMDVVGDEIEMDRAVLDQLRDPLTHLVRNAVDHAIEEPHKRLLAGKDERGGLELTISGQGGTIHITLQDDGKGIDLEAVKQKAIRERLVTPEDANAMGPDALMELIFLPGFSSREMVTSVSGRGVGLDVVRANLRQINGQVKVSSTTGKGTTFTLSVPLTLATERGLLVRVSGGVYALPIAHVERIRSVPKMAIQTLEAGPAVTLDGHPMPLYKLSNLLGLPPAAMQDDPMSVVVLSKGWHQVAVEVDGVVGEQEIIIKPFQAPIRQLNYLKGGNLDRNGDIVLVLDSGALVDAALEGGHRQLPMSTMQGEHDAQQEEQSPPHILVVDDSITTRTLEKNILEAQGFKVSVSVHGRAGWERLQEEPFDLVISDVEMPYMNGFELASTVRADSRFDDMPIIIVSSLASEENQRRGMEAGADAYIIKGSFETATLLKTVRELLA